MPRYPKRKSEPDSAVGDQVVLNGFAERQPEAFVERKVETESQPKIKGMRLRLTPENQIDLDWMGDEQKKRFLEAVRATPGLTTGTGEPEQIELTDDKVKAILTGLGKMNAFLFKWGMAHFAQAKVDLDIALSIAYTEAQITELTPPVKHIGNRHLPDWYKKYGDYVDLVGMLAYYTGVNFQHAVAAQALRDVLRAKPNGHGEPVPEPVQ